MHHVDYIVAQFLALFHKVDEDCAGVVAIEVVVNRFYVVFLELLAHEVYHVLDAIGLLDAVILHTAAHHHVHLGEGIVGEDYHRLQLVQLVVGELLFTVVLSLEDF